MITGLRVTDTGPGAPEQNMVIQKNWFLLEKSVSVKVPKIVNSVILFELWLNCGYSLMHESMDVMYEWGECMQHVEIQQQTVLLLNSINLFK